MAEKFSKHHGFSLWLKLTKLFKASLFLSIMWNRIVHCSTCDGIQCEITWTYHRLPSHGGQQPLYPRHTTYHSTGDCQHQSPATRCTRTTHWRYRLPSAHLKCLWYELGGDCCGIFLPPWGPGYIPTRWKSMYLTTDRWQYCSSLPHIPSVWYGLWSVLGDVVIAGYEHISPLMPCKRKLSWRVFLWEWMKELDEDSVPPMVGYATHLQHDASYLPADHR